MAHVTLSPQLCYSLGLQIEVDSLLSVEVRISEEAASRPGEREHRQRNGNWNINSDISHIDLLHKFSGCRAVSCEDAGSVSVGVLVDELDGIVDGFCGEADKDWTEDLLSVALHGGEHVGEDGGAHEVSLFVARYDDVAAVENKFSALVDT